MGGARLIEPGIYLRFAQEYVRDYSGANAARRLNLKPQTASQLIANPDVRAHIIRLSEGQLRAADISAERVMLQLARLSFADRGGLYNDAGEIRAVPDIPEDLRACIVGVKVETVKTRMITDPAGVPEKIESTVVTEVKFEKPSTSLTLLAKHFKLVDGETDGVNALANALADRLAEARARRYAGVVAEDIEAHEIRPLLANASAEVTEGIYRDVFDLEPAIPDLGQI